MQYRHIAIYYTANCFVFIISSWLLLHLFNNHQLLAAALGTKLDADRVEEIIDLRKKMSLVGLCFIPIVLAVKYGFIFFPLYAGVLTEEVPVRSGDLLKAIIQYDFIFALPLLIRYIYFSWLNPEYTLVEIQMCPLSLASLIGSGDLPPPLLYSMQALNVFEIAFIIMLINHFKKLFNRTGRATIFICKYYILPLLAWYILVSLLSLL